MTKSKDILNELNELNSRLGSLPVENLYVVPAGYFDGLAATILARIKALEAVNAVDELKALSGTVSSLSKQMPYTVPSGYFDTLAEKVLQGINVVNQSANEEIETLSPLLSSLKKQNPYSVPAGYFDNAIEAPVKEEIKVISITRRRWFRLAAAAMVIGVLVMGGIYYFNFKNRPDPVNQPYAWVKKNIKVAPEEIDAFIKTTDQTVATQPEEVAATTVNPEEIKELMKDVPDQDIQDFLNETASANTEVADDAAMN